MVNDVLDLANVQGNILRGYRGNLKYVRHVILEVTDRNAARAFLGASASGQPTDGTVITRATPWGDENPPTCFNIGITFAGMRALGTPDAMLASFPTEFTDGMEKRALKLGDFGDSAPAAWPQPFDTPDRVHIIASIYAERHDRLQEIEDSVAKAFTVLGHRDGSARTDSNVLGPAYADDGSPDNRVFFGYADSISQPRFTIAGYPDLDDDPGALPVDRALRFQVPVSPLGTALLGYDTPLEGVRFRVPMSDDLGQDGSFNAFRILAQDTRGFEDYLDEAAALMMELEAARGPLLLPAGGESAVGPGLDRFGALREAIAAQMCGRWRNGTPVAISPLQPFTNPTPEQLSDFGYAPPRTCPAGAHIRRVSPRDGQIVQRAANYTRSLIRRGMPYGPDFDAADRNDDERGLLGNFIGASLGAQFEAVMCDWLNLGLHDPDITSSNDPLIGANTKETSWFDLRLIDGTPHRIRNFPRFVRTRGGAYTFLPSIRAIAYLATLRG